MSVLAALLFVASRVMFSRYLIASLAILDSSESIYSFFPNIFKSLNFLFTLVAFSSSF